MLIGGIIIFSASNGTAKGGAQQSMLGGLCVLVALVCDALLGNVQQRVMAEEGVSVA